MTGNWTQGPKPLALNLAYVKEEAAWEIPKPPPPPKMMPANADPVFEVATVKPSDPNRPGKAFSVRGNEVITVNTTVRDLMVFAYGVHARQITGGPSWLETDKYDINGKPEGGLPNNNQFRVMIQKLLADRFQLAFHHEKERADTLRTDHREERTEAYQERVGWRQSRLIFSWPGKFCRRGTPPWRNLPA